MDNTELEKRKASAATETLVISHTDGGFRVYNPANITHLSMVSGIPDSPKCNCPDFEAHQSDPEWRCKHILAVLNQVPKQGATPAPETSEAPEQKESEPKLAESAGKKKLRAPRNGQHSQMLIKRSISPDGKINSLSVIFSNPIDTSSDQEIIEQAHKCLKLQAEIVDEFLKGNGNRRPNAETNEKANGSANPNGKSQNSSSQPAKDSAGAVPAQLLNIAGMDTRGGWKTFINVQVNGTTTKLFGSKHELGQHITAAGFASIAEHISQGMMLNLPCRVVTKRSPDGKYLDIERVLPIKPLEEPGRRGQ